MLNTRYSSAQTRPLIFLSGLIGLVAGGLLVAGSVWIVSERFIPILLPFPLTTWLLGLPFAAVSVAEIPMMVYTMRRLLVERSTNYGLVLGLNALFVFFAAVYALPVLLLTGSLGWGLALYGLSFARLIASLIFLPLKQQPSPPHGEQEGQEPPAPQADSGTRQGPGEPGPPREER